jgi:7-cyano-7-deazaguanine synthase
VSASASTPAVVLLSGGLDSTTTLARAVEVGHEVYALSFRYSQRHEVELECAARQATRFGARAHEILDLSGLGRLIASATSLVQGSARSVPAHDQRKADEIPSTYVPARNTLFLAHALAWAEVVGAVDLWLGVNAVDYSGYPDCRPEFLSAFQTLAKLATRAGVEGESFRVHAPLMDLHKHEIIREGIRLGVDYSDTVSCYDPTVVADDERKRVLACGRCESCELRRLGFLEAGVADPTLYTDP